MKINLFFIILQVFMQIGLMLVADSFVKIHQKYSFLYVL